MGWAIDTAVPRVRVQGVTKWAEEWSFKQKQMIFWAQQILSYSTNDKEFQSTIVIF
jgi:hypothetical protein